MTVKPNDLFFGLKEFLAYIVPGFIFCATLINYVQSFIPEYLDITLKEPKGFAWISFMMISYLIGHFLHHICAMTLNPLYEATYLKIKRKKHRDIISATEVYLKTNWPEHTNYIKVAEAYLRLNRSELFVDLEKHEANSKLFRSLVLLSVYLCFHSFNEQIIILLLITVAILSFMKFANERWNYQLKIYQYIHILSERGTNQLPII